MKNSNKFILVTGSESQMGKELCSRLFYNQFKVIKIDRFKKKQKDYYQIDFTNKKQIKKTLFKLTKQYKNIYALFNLAASQVFTSFEKRTHEEIDEIMDVNIKSNILMTQFVFNKYFKKNKQGKIINISSIFGFSSPDFKNYESKDRKSSEIYGASKAAIIQLTKYFAKYMSNYNINVNCVSPGGIKNFKTQNKKFIYRYSKKVPLKRMANIGEICDLLLFLLSEKSNYINGDNIVIDGGYTV